jgi:hypothetical protein
MIFDVIYERPLLQTLLYFFIYFFRKVLTNLLETDDLKCKTGSLRVLREITVHPSIRRSVTLMGGIELLIKILSDPNPELQLLSTETVANLARFRKARRIVRKTGGIPKLVDLLDVDPSKVIFVFSVRTRFCTSIT